MCTWLCPQARQHPTTSQPADDADSSSDDEQGGLGGLQFAAPGGMTASFRSVGSGSQHLTRRERQRRVPETVRKGMSAAGQVAVPREETWEARTGALTVSKPPPPVAQEEEVASSMPSSARSKGAKGQKKPSK